MVGSRLCVEGRKEAGGECITIVVRNEVILILNKLRIVFALVAFVLSIYGLMTSDYRIIPIILFSLSAMTFVAGLSEFKKARKRMAIILFLTSAFTVFVLIQNLVLR